MPPGWKPASAKRLILDAVPLEDLSLRLAHRLDQLVAIRHGVVTEVREQHHGLSFGCLHQLFAKIIQL